MTDVNTAFGFLSGLFETEDIYLAGGFVRDTALHQPIKDADFFVKGQPRPFGRLRLQVDVLKSKGFVEVKPKFQSYKHPHIFAIYRNETNYTIPVEVIITTKPPMDFILKDFDWGLCKCWQDYHGNTTFDEHFMQDYINQTHTMKTNNPILAKRSLSHLDRILAKYPWPWRIDCVQD